MADKDKDKREEQKAVLINRRFSVPMSSIEFHAVRASGPGGQHVNKTSSAVTLQLDLANLKLPDEYRTRIMAHRDRRISDNGVVTIKAQKHRTQHRNRIDAIERLKELLVKAVTVPEPRRKTKPSYSSVQKRLKSKTKRSAIKKNRGRPGEMD